MVDLQERVDKTILKLATLNSSVHLNMQRLREEHDEAPNADKCNGTTETIEKLGKLRQILEGKKVDAVEIGEEQDMIREQLQALQQISN